MKLSAPKEIFWILEQKIFLHKILHGGRFCCTTLQIGKGSGGDSERDRSYRFAPERIGGSTKGGKHIFLN
jgi:hypothetical protein